MSQSATEAVQLSFKHTEDEYLAATRFYFWHSKDLLTRVVVSFVVFSAFLVLLPLFMGFPLPVWANLAMIAIAGVAWFHGYVVDRPRAYFRGDPKFRDEYHLTFTD